MNDFNVETVRCGECGAAVGEPANTPLDARVPCPSCGSKSRTMDVGATDTLGLSGHLSALHERGGEAIGFSETEREGRASSATLSGEGLLEIAITGSSPQGEEDTPTTCRVLKEHLNTLGARWGQIVPGREPADCVFIDSEDSNKTLEVQVVRAIASESLWRELNSSRSVRKSLSPSEIVAEIRAAVGRKAGDENIPRPLRARLVIGLDATRLSGMGFDAIVREFRSTSLDWVRSHGFAALYLVGPVPRLCGKLD